MGITLTSKTINSTYDSLLKLSDNDQLTGAFKVITDGLGNDTGLSLNNTGDVTISGTLTVNTRINTPLLQLTGGTGTQGELSWNADEETLDLVNNGAVLQLGQEIHIHVRNNSVTTAIPNGTPVYVAGTLGASGRLKVAPMIADGSIAPEYFIGVTTEDIEADGDGKVTFLGKVRGFNTLAYPEGSKLYVSETVAGGWQTTEPTAPHPKLEVAFTVNSANNGTLFVRSQNGHYLTDTHDINITSVADKDLLVYDSALGIWKNSKTLGDISTGNITTSGYLRGPETFIIDPAAYGNNTGLVQILGDLRVDGVTTTVNSTTVTINDKNIVLADEAATAADANGAGITINGAGATLTYASATDDFTFNKDIVVTRENDNSLITFFRGGNNPTTNELLGQFVFKTDFDGNPQTWARIDIDTNDSAVRTDMDFSVKSTSGNIETALKLQGGSAKPKAFFYNSVTAPTFIGALTGNASTASKWATARTLTIGDTGKSLDGSANVSWTRAELGITKNNIDALNINADQVDGLDKTDFTLDYVTGNGNSTTNDIVVGNIYGGSLTINNIEVIDSNGDFQISGFDFTNPITVSSGAAATPLTLYGVDTTVGSLTTELQFTSAYDGSWYLYNWTGSTYDVSSIIINDREDEFGGIILNPASTAAGGFYSDRVELISTEITGTLDVSGVTTLSANTYIEGNTYLKDSLFMLDANGSSYSTVVYRDGTNPHVLMAGGGTSTQWNTAYGWGDWSNGVDKAFVDALNVDADTLDGLDSLKFFRKDQDMVFDRAATRQIIFNSDTNYGSDKAFLYFNENSTFHRTGTENVRFSIGAFNDFSNSSVHSDAVDIQGGSRLYLNAGDWDTELDSAIGTPATGSYLDSEPIQFAINNTKVGSFSTSGLSVSDSAQFEGTTKPIRIGDGFGSGGSATIHKYQADLYLQYNNGQTATTLQIGGGGTATSIRDAQNQDFYFASGGGDSYFAHQLGVGVTSAAAMLDIHMSDSNGTYGRGKDGNLNLENTNTSVTEGGWMSISGYMGNTTSQYQMGMISGGKQTAAADGNYGGYLSFWTTSGGGNGEANSGGYERMRINSSGDVGIGTTSPSYKLDVNGESRLGKNITTWSNSPFTNSSVLFSETGWNTVIGSNGQWSTNYVALKTNGDFVHIGNNLGIGTTSPSEKLDVDGNIAISGTTFVDSERRSIRLSSFDNGGGAGIFFRDGFTYNCSITAENHNSGAADGICISGYDGISFSTGSNSKNEVAIIDIDGNVGIGTTSPTYKFEVSNGTQTGTFNPNSSGFMFLGSTSNHPLWLGANDAVKMVINTSGKVGIGTTSPSAKLHVSQAGNVNGGSLLIGSEGSGTDKWSFLAGAHYNQSSGSGNGSGSAGVALIGSFSTITENRVHIGGSPWEINAATSIHFNTHTSTTSTAGGTERMRIDSSGNVTIRDGKKLILNRPDNAIDSELSTNSAGTLILNSRNGEGFDFQNASTSAMLIDSSGNVGIGVSPSQKLSVLSTSTTATVAKFSATNYGNLGTTYIEIGTQYGDGGSRIGSLNPTGNQSTLVFETMTATSGVYSERMRINSSGNVGIGTGATISEKLDVNGNVKVGPDNGLSSSPSYIWLGNNYSNGTTRDKCKIYLYNSGTEQYGFSVGGSGDIQYHSNAYHDFYIGNSNRVRIDSSGRVLIGRTSNATSQKLQVQGYIDQTDTSTAMRLYDGTTFVGGIGNGSWGFSSTYLNDYVVYAQNDLLFTAGGGSTPKMILNSSGNVGIGTTSPYRNLHVNGANATLRVGPYYTSGGDRDFVDLIAHGTDSKIVSNNERFHVENNSGHILLMPSGYVGIKQTTPTAPLDVRGVRIGRDFSIADRATVRLDAYGTTKPADILFGHSTAANQTSWNGVYWSISSRAAEDGNKFSIWRGSGNPTGGSEYKLMTFDPNLRVGIKQNSPSYELDVSGTIRATGDVIAYSDERVKENIKTIPNALDSVKEMRGVFFNKIGEERQSTGVIAQEIEKILPQVVQEDDNGMKSVAYGNIVGVLIEAIKEQQQQIETLKQLINK